MSPSAAHDINRLGILAGRGTLPTQLVAHCLKHHIPYFVLIFDDGTAQHAEIAEHIADDMQAIITFGQIGKGLDLLRGQSVSHLVMAGSLSRPSFKKLKMDATAKRLLKKIGLKLLSGDDALLRALMEFLEKEGFTMLAAHEILGGLTLDAGCYTKVKPSDAQQASAAKGLDMLRTIGALDIGQALVIEDGYVLGVEAAEGTDGLMKRCIDLAKTPGEALLVKAIKPEQDSRADIPTIGPNTMEAAAAGGYAGIAIEADKVQVIDKENVIRIADQHRVFLVAI